MFCDRTLNAKINRLHERALRIAYNDYISSFEDLLVKDGSVTIHEKNLRSFSDGNVQNKEQVITTFFVIY